MLHPLVAEDLWEISSAPLPWGRLAGKTVLVTGAAGFLPSWIVETLLHLNESRASGITVLALVRDLKTARARFAHHRGRKDLRFLRQDAADPVHWKGPVDYIVHGASHATPSYYAKDPTGTMAPNVLGTWRLLELARAKKSKGFLFLSSSEVYGAPSAKGAITEDDLGRLDPMAVRSCYAESKRAGETMCAAWRHQYGVAAFVVRPFHTYGPGMALNDGRVFSDIVGDIVAGRPVTLRSDGRARRAYCYVADAVGGFFSVLLKGRPGEAYNVANDQAEVSVRELADRLVRLFPERRLRVIRAPAKPGYLKSRVPRQAPDVSKLRSLGWRPRHGLESGFRRAVECSL